MSVSNGAPASPQGAATPPFCLQGSRGARIAGWDCAPSAAAAPPPPPSSPPLWGVANGTPLLPAGALPHPPASVEPLPRTAEFCPGPIAPAPTP